MKRLTKETLAKFALSENEEKRFVAAKHIHTPEPALLKLTLDENYHIRQFALKTLERKRELKEELRILVELKRLYHTLREKSNEDGEIPEEEWEFLQNTFWNLNIVNKRFERWFNKRFGPDAIKDYDKIDHCGYYAFTFMEEVLSKWKQKSK
ncbi:MAG: hypothetical protein QXI58_01195 [Candidatus Micrarchaeia archaeon]